MTKPTFHEEKKLWKNGVEYVIGVDEVGRGAFAGPVVVAAVVITKSSFAKKIFVQNINDSKKLSHHRREQLTPHIKKHAAAYVVAQTGIRVINKKGIGKATEIAFRKAIKKAMQKINKLSITISPRIFLLVDGIHIKYVRNIGLKNQKAIIKGDQKSITIASASIIAKVRRDALMKDLDKVYPKYGFAENKGYGTKKHRQILQKHGMSNIHRTSFRIMHFTKMSR